ncbi:T9SS type A sorting domain-containing protein [Gaetbulibacter saemankumensis]|uniref:T9SS type A sorting domain-containing protein n=1 Tax=Gaetbulibacter saemankumensis TaxID=311208 RepID=UPI00041FD7BB|nr:T9SS type A sorting domain-containing protein [Gaetbulibacter saemankumensis]
MDSAFDVTLSNTTIETEKPKIIAKTNSLEVSNTIREFKSYTIYSVSGKAVSQSQQQFNMAQIDISALSSGFYILNLEGTNGQRFLHKFVK